MGPRQSHTNAQFVTIPGHKVCPSFFSGLAGYSHRGWGELLCKLFVGVAAWLTLPDYSKSVRFETHAYEITGARNHATVGGKAWARRRNPTMWLKLRSISPLRLDTADGQNPSLLRLESRPSLCNPLHGRLDSKALRPASPVRAAYRGL